jgi:hypothetical protein
VARRRRRPDDDRRVAAPAQRRVEALGCADRARGLDRLRAGDVGRHGLGARGDHELVEPLGALRAGRVADGQAACVEVDRDHLGPRVHLDAVLTVLVG